jgi:hypothetical protein
MIELLTGILVLVFITVILVLVFVVYILFIWEKEESFYLKSDKDDLKPGDSLHTIPETVEGYYFKIIGFPEEEDGYYNYRVKLIPYKTPKQ